MRRNKMTKLSTSTWQQMVFKAIILVTIFSLFLAACAPVNLSGSAGDGDETATAVPDTAVPDTAVPDTAVPDTAVPDTAVPDTAVPGTAVPDTAVSDTAMPDTAVPDT